MPQLQAPKEQEAEFPKQPDAAPADDRGQLQGGEPVLLIIEDDLNFASVMMEFAHEKGFKAVIAGTAGEAIGLAQRINPAAITLDLVLPDTDGWVVLDRLKHDVRTRHIPVHVISVEEQRQRSLKLGAVSHLLKPVTREAIDQALSGTVEFMRRPVKNLLVVEDDAVQRQSLQELIGNNDVHTIAVATGAEALQMLESEIIDCVVVDLVLPDMPGVELIREIQRSEGYSECFGTNKVDCGQSECLWRKDCLEPAEACKPKTCQAAPAAETCKPKACETARPAEVCAPKACAPKACEAPRPAETCKPKASAKPNPGPSASAAPTSRKTPPNRRGGK